MENGGRKDFLPSTDLSEFLKTEKLGESWYVLSNEDVSVLVDTVKPRIFMVYVHGQFGTLQQLIYHPNGYEREMGMWGIVPTYYVDGEKFFPFLHVKHVKGIYLDNPPEKVVFDRRQNRIKMVGVKCFSEEKRKLGNITMEILLNNNKIKLVVDYPKEAERTEVSSVWYPLYNKYRQNDISEWRDIEYFQEGFMGHYEPYFEKMVDKNINLFDKYGRVPQIRISSFGKSCYLKSGTDPHRGNVFNLQILIKGDNKRDKVIFEFLPNPISIRVNPLITAGKSERVEIYSKEKPKVYLDEQVISVTKEKEGVYKTKIIARKGKHILFVRTTQGVSCRKFYAVGEVEPSLVKMGKTAVKLPWKTMSLNNIVPSMYTLDSLEPRLRIGVSFIHAYRIIPVIITTALISKDKSYVNRAFECVEAVVKKSHQFDNGDLLTPIGWDSEGKPALTNASRPSDLGIIIRALLYTYYGLRYFKDNRAKRCLDYASSYAHTLLRMQNSDGGFCCRNTYPDLKGVPKAEGRGTVNNWIIQVWELANIYEGVNSVRANELKQMCIRYIDWYFFKRKPNALRVCGSGENAPNHTDALANLSAFALVKYLSSGEEIYKQYAEQAFKMAAFTCMHFIDQPEHSFFPALYKLGQFYNQPDGVLSYGGMHDLEIIEAGLFLKKYLNFDFGEYVASYNFGDRLAAYIKDNGAIYGFVAKAPNYYYRREDAAETLDYGGVGIYGYYYVTRKR